FPVLRSAAALTSNAHPAARTPDPHELRRRAFAALRQLLTSLGESRPLILAIDDLQWGDADSALLLAELLRPREPPVLLLLASYRIEDEQTSPFLQAFLPEVARIPTGVRKVLEVEPLTPDETRELALRLLGRDDAEARLRAESVVRESGGN